MFITMARGVDRALINDAQNRTGSSKKASLSLCDKYKYSVISDIAIVALALLVASVSAALILSYPTYSGATCLGTMVAAALFLSTAPFIEFAGNEADVRHVGNLLTSNGHLL